MSPQVSYDESKLPQKNTAKAKWTIITALVAILFIWSGRQVEFSLSVIWEGLPDFWDLLTDMFPPNWGMIPKLIKPFTETIQIAVLGTLIGAVFAVPISLLSARNVNKIPALYYISKGIMNLIRTIPQLLYAAILVAAVGLGPFPGVIALSIFSMSIIAKLTSESLEAIDPGPMEAIETVGGNKIETIIYAIVPQIAPSFVSFCLYVFEINIRTSTVLGLVGAGGIGQTLMTSLSLFMYQRAATIILATFVFVVIIDFASTKLRERLI